MKLLIKVCTVAFLLGISAHSAGPKKDNQLFKQLKGDMWLMGLDFSYNYGENLLSSQGNNMGEQSPSLAHLPEEIIYALDL